MSDDKNTPHRRVPTLTEVVLLSEPEPVDIPLEEVAAPEVLADPSAPVPPAPDSQASPPSNLEDQMTERVWAELQRQVDLMLEYRLCETLGPILSRATEAVLRETRQQLASTLRDVVARAVAEELSRHRGR
mgnify:CR=1 FL=1